MVQITGQRENGITFFELASDQVRARVTNLGCHILSLGTKDKAGSWDDIVLGFKEVEDCFHDDSCMGAVVGRVANRIGQAAFMLNGREYQLAANCGPHHLHGGLEGFNRKLFDYELLPDGIQFHYLSKDMEEGYPGNLHLHVTYRLEENRFRISFRTSTDQDTIVNVTNHTYFNLSGAGSGNHAFKEDIEHHLLRIDAGRIACVDDNGLACGDYLPVAGTPFDFREAHEIGERIRDDHVQLKNAGGYDHSWILNGKEGLPGQQPSGQYERPEGSAAADQMHKMGRACIELSHPKTGRRVSVFTSFPVVQVYTGNYLAGGADGRHGAPYGNRDGIALETQYLSNSIQIEDAPSVVLLAGQVREDETIWVFDCMTEDKTRD